jgi:hypothetical protein
MAPLPQIRDTTMVTPTPAIEDSTRRDPAYQISPRCHIRKTYDMTGANMTSVVRIYKQQQKGNKKAESLLSNAENGCGKDDPPRSSGVLSYPLPTVTP